MLTDEYEKHGVYWVEKKPRVSVNGDGSEVRAVLDFGTGEIYHAYDFFRGRGRKEAEAAKKRALFTLRAHCIAVREWMKKHGEEL